MAADLSLRDQRVVVKYLFLKKTDPTEIHKQLTGVCGEGTASYKVVKGWIKDFTEGHEDPLDSVQGNGNGNSAPTDPAVVARLEVLVNTDRRITLDQAAEMTGVTMHVAQTIISNVLGLKLVCKRWSTRLLTPEQRQNRIATCQELMERYETEGDDFLSKIVTGDMTFVNYFTQDERRSSTVTQRPSVTVPQNRVLYAIFYDMQGMLLVHQIPENTTITAEYYAYLLRDLLMPVIKRKRKDRKVILLHDSTALTSARLTQEALKDLEIETLPQPPDSPDLLPSEFWLYPHLRNLIKSSTFKDRCSTWAALQHHTGTFTPFDLGESIRKLPDRWNKVIDFSGGLHIL